MAIIEVVFPQLKKDADSVKAALEKLPVAHRAFREGGATRGSQGFMVSENGKDTTSDFREVVMLEWPTESTFHDFVGSPVFGDFMAAIKPYATGPPQLNLFETNDGSHLFSSGILEVLLISPKSAEDVRAILNKVQLSLDKANDSISVYGSSLNLPEKKIAIMRVFTSNAELDFARNSSYRQEFLKEIETLAEVIQYVVDTKQIPL